MRKRLAIATGFFIFAILISSALAQEDDFSLQRKKMVEEQLISRGISDERVLEVMAKVPRHMFVPEDIRSHAYADTALRIGYGQTISQPYIVAFMTQAAALKPDDRVLEIGTGSGYQAAILAEIVKEVYSIEILEPLYNESLARLEKLGYANITLKCADGYAGWKEKAPFDAIIVTAAPAEIPQALAEQLAMGGRMVIPVGEFFQSLFLVTRTESGIEKQPLLPVRFVPMVHSAGEAKAQP